MFFIIIIYNNSKNSVTGYTFNELIYGFKMNENLSLLADLEHKDFDKIKSLKYKVAKRAIAFANAMTKI